MTAEEIVNEECAMNLDELIAVLQEAKEHGIDGRSKILIQGSLVTNPSYIVSVEYDSNKVTIKYG